VSRSTFDRRVLPVIETVEMPWGTKLVPVDELERYRAEHTEQPRMARRPSRSGRRSTMSTEVVARIRRERAQGSSLAEIANRLNRDGIPTGQGGRQWWPSTVRAVLRCRNLRDNGDTAPVTGPTGEPR
jgi:hypothetical protein